MHEQAVDPLAALDHEVIAVIGAERIGTVDLHAGPDQTVRNIGTREHHRGTARCGDLDVLLRRRLRPLISSVTVRVAAGVPKPATVAMMRVLAGSQACAGAATDSTVQFGVAAAPTLCSTRVTPGGSRSSLKSGGSLWPACH